MFVYLFCISVKNLITNLITRSKVNNLLRLFNVHQVVNWQRWKHGKLNNFGSLSQKLTNSHKEIVVNWKKKILYNTMINIWIFKKIIVEKMKNHIFHMYFNWIYLHKCWTFTKLVRSRWKWIHVYLNFNFPSWVIKVRIILSFAKLSIQVAGEVNEGFLLFQKIKQVKRNISLFIVPMPLGYPCMGIIS
jgi:hypothetical protein